MTEHDPHVRTELGAYALGALEPADRRAVERHLDDCQTCRNELTKLSVLPSLLDRLSVEEATADYDEVRRDLDALLRRSTAAESRRLRRQLAVWRTSAAVAAAAAVLAGVLAWAPWDTGPDRVVVAVVPLAQDASGIDGTVAAYAWEWGTTVEVRVEDLPAAASYALWAVSHDGERERAGTWGPTAHRGAFVRGASAIQRDRLARVEVTDADGAPLFAAIFDPEA